MAEKKKKVGYASPPVEHRFAPGQSGNPAGRPKSPKAPPKTNSEAEILQRLDNEIITVNGREMTRLELELAVLHAKGSRGDMRALRLLNNKRAALNLQQPKKAVREGGLLVLPATLPFDEWEARAAAQQAKYRERRVEEPKKADSLVPEPEPDT